LLYTIRHVTEFRYSQPIRESQMEVRKRPRSDEGQRCLEFSLSVEPDARVHSYVDHLGNTVHHFDVARLHQELRMSAVSWVERLGSRKLPERLSSDAWAETARFAQDFNNWDWLHPSQYATPSEALRSFVNDCRIARRDDPMSTLRELNTALHGAIAYVPKSTRVDSPIDECLQNRKGVCQDFAHVFITIARGLGIPCRYVSGHLFHRGNGGSNAIPTSASHAWAEALLPELGWVGFDPANHSLAEQDHIRIAVGRDYADVPPARGVFMGMAESELTVEVDVREVPQ